MGSIAMQPIGFVSSQRDVPLDDDWGRINATITIDSERFTVAALQGLSAPVLDLKPYMAEFAPRGQVRQPAWSHELMAGYWGRPDGSI